MRISGCLCALLLASAVQAQTPTWAGLGSGPDGITAAMEVIDDGNGPVLYAGGTFNSAGGTPAINVARSTTSKTLPVRRRQ